MRRTISAQQERRGSWVTIGSNRSYSLSSGPCPPYAGPELSAP
jgi:hypothetical protein